MRGERGSVSIVIAAGVGMALVIAIGVADVGRALVARSRAEAVADLAALAAAQDLAVPSDGDPALAADRYASANGARLVSCSCSVGSTEATVSVAVHVGGFLGAMTLNYVVAIGIWLVMLGVALVLTVPTVPVVPLLALSAVILIGIPLWFYPRSRMLWAAIEFLVHRSDPDYRAPVARDPRTRDLE